MTQQCLLCLVVMLTTVGGSLDGDIFSSVYSMEQLMETMKAETLKEYSRLETMLSKYACDSDRIRRHIEELDEKVAKFDELENVHHPVDAYRLIRSLYTILNNTLTSLLEELQQLEQEIMETEIFTSLAFDEDNFISTLRSILVLQSTYNLETHDMANGNFSGCQSALSMTAKECSQLSVTAFEHHSFTSLPTSWLQESVKRARNGDDSIAVMDIYTTVADLMIKAGYKTDAIKLYREATQYEPHGQHADKLKVLEHEHTKGPTYSVLPKTSVMQTHSDLCQGKMNELSARETKARFCYLQHSHPRLTLTPAKVEVRSLEPYIVLFHNVLNSREISWLNSRAKSKLERSEVRARTGGPSKKSFLRSSKSAVFLHPSQDEILAPKVEALTGLTCRKAYEALQVANYGIGGQYFNHKDFFPDESNSKVVDNRLATFMIYLSNVESGGATIFPHVQETIYPEEGMGVFWYNLYRNGTGDMETEHAACPVLVGDKWIANYWIHLKGHELIKPCDVLRNSRVWFKP